MFSKKSYFTDDSILTIAVAEAFIDSDGDKELFKEQLILKMKEYGKRYPNAGYGGCFRHWLVKKKPKPYGSYGNGSEMRVSAVGWLYPTIERTREVRRYVQLKK